LKKGQSRLLQNAVWHPSGYATSRVGDHNLDISFSCYSSVLFYIFILFLLEEEKKKKLYLARSHKLQSLGFEAWA
jgi:hypothetical protein